jgi:sugar phosphate isomerase/epimerase
VVVVHVNDASIVPSKSRSWVSAPLPGATGVIDSAGFFAALRHIGYDGPVTCEPMPNSIEALGTTDEDEIIAAVKHAMDDVSGAIPVTSYHASFQNVCFPRRVAADFPCPITGCGAAR